MDRSVVLLLCGVLGACTGKDSGVLPVDTARDSGEDTGEPDDTVLELMVLGEEVAEPGVLAVHTNTGGRGLVLFDAGAFPDAGCGAGGSVAFAAGAYTAPNIVIAEDDGGWETSVWATVDEGDGPVHTRLVDGAVTVRSVLLLDGSNDAVSADLSFVADAPEEGVLDAVGLPAGGPSSAELRVALAVSCSWP